MDVVDARFNSCISYDRFRPSVRLPVRLSVTRWYTAVSCQND